MSESDKDVKYTRIRGLIRQPKESVGFWPFKIAERMPDALGVRSLAQPGQRTWEDWREEMLAKYPVRFRLGYHWPWHASVWFHRKLLNPLGEAWYFIRSHTYRRYHFLDMRNEKNGYRWGYIETDQALLFSAMAILVTFVEVERGFDGDIDWDSEDLHRQVKETGLGIYKWWKETRPAALAAQNAYYRQKGRQSQEDMRAHREAEAKLKQDEDDKLAELIKIRRYLWT